MATATILLPLLGAVPDDTNPPELKFNNNTPVYAFDDTTDELVYWDFRCPENFSASLAAIVQCASVSGTLGSIHFGFRVMLVTPNLDTQDMDAENYLATALGSVSATTVAGALRELRAELTETALAGGDYVRVEMRRENTADTHTADVDVRAVALEYTTS